jgi:hypothetical protein
MKPATIDKHLEKLLTARLAHLRSPANPLGMEYFRKLSDKEAITKIALFVMGIEASNYSTH